MHEELIAFSRFVPEHQIMPHNHEFWREGFDQFHELSNYLFEKFHRRTAHQIKVLDVEVHIDGFSDWESSAVAPAGTGS